MRILSVSDIYIDHRCIRRAGGDLLFSVVAQGDHGKVIEVIRHHPLDRTKAEVAHAAYVSQMIAQS
jgi:hypothetical protein